MPNTNLPNEQKKERSNTPMEPGDRGDGPNSEIKCDGGVLSEMREKIAPPNNSVFVSTSPTSNDLDIERRELYQINNFVR